MRVDVDCEFCHLHGRGLFYDSLSIEKQIELFFKLWVKRFGIVALLTCRRTR